MGDRKSEALGVELRRRKKSRHHHLLHFSSNTPVLLPSGSLAPWLLLTGAPSGPDALKMHCPSGVGSQLENLQRAKGHNVRVKNAGISGDTSSPTGYT